MSDLAKSLVNMEKDAANLIVKSEKFQGADSSLTASKSKKDSDAASANGSLSDAAEKTDKKLDEDEGTAPKDSLHKSENVNASDVTDTENSEAKENEDVEKAEKVQPSDNLEKSIKDSEEGAKAFEVSSFLQKMTSELSKSLEGVQTSLNGKNVTTEDTLSAFAKSFGTMFKSQQAVLEQNVQLTTLVKGLTGKLEAVSNRLEEVEGEPTMRKSVRNIAIHEKDFNKSISGDPQEISKSEKLSVMNDLLVKSDTVVPMDIINLESGAILRPEVEARIAQVVASRK